MAGREGPRRFVTGATVPEPAGREGPRAIGDVVLSVRDLCVRYDLRAGAWRRVWHRIQAVEHVSFELRSGETLALVGESGSGKSTTGPAILGLATSCSGQVVLAGQAIDGLRGQALRTAIRATQMVF